MKIANSLVILLFSLTMLNACSPETSTNTSSSSGAASESNAQSESDRLTEWLDQQYEIQLTYSPMSLTYLGRKELYDQINDMSEAGEDKYLAWRKNSVEEMLTSFEYEDLSDDAKLSYDLWAYQYQQQESMLPFRRHEYVFNQMGGGHTSLPNFLINYHKVDDEKDANAYVKRIEGVGLAIQQLLEKAKAHAEGGVRPPQFAYTIVIDESKKLTSGKPFDPQSSDDAPLWADIKKKVSELEKAGTLDHVKAETIKAKAKVALLDHFQPAYNNLISWLEEDFNNSDAEPKGVGQLPNGENYYNAALKNNTTLELTADEIHQIGLNEVERIRGEMEAVKESVGFEGDLMAFFDFVKTDKQFFYPNTDEGRQAYIDDSTAYINAMKQKLPEYFGILPKADLVVKRVEAFREQDGAPQHYSSSSPDGSRPGVYYAHLSDMNSMPKVEMESVAYHEALPGHHMQIAIAQELQGIPKFRNQAGFTAYIEGWGLYAELLAKEMGAYENPYQNLGRLSAEIWRAIRLVVDTGIHAKGWSEQQAIDFFKQNSPIADGQIRAEVKRYIVIPGQATGYKIGMLKILELREKAKNSLGEKFDIREFHDQILGGGSIPLPMLEDVINRWIDSKTV